MLVVEGAPAPAWLLHHPGCLLRLLLLRHHLHLCLSHCLGRCWHTPLQAEKGKTGRRAEQRVARQQSIQVA
jgi:hypothetical protein